MLSDLKYIKVGEKNFPVKYSFRAIKGYNQQIADNEADSNDEFCIIFYHLAKAGAKFANEEFNYGYEEFIDLIDDYFFEAVEGFNKAFGESNDDKKKQNP
jgi:hypothetical protein